MKAKYNALWKQHTWTLVLIPINQTILGSRWVFKIKLNSDGSIRRFKARLVVQGNHQEYGGNLFDTFSLVAMFSNISSCFYCRCDSQVAYSSTRCFKCFLVWDSERYGVYETTAWILRPYLNVVCLIKVFMVLNNHLDNGFRHL